MPAKCFDIDSHPVARANGGNFRADLLDDAYHFMPHGNAGHGTRDTAVLDVQVAGANASERHANDGIAWALKRRDGLFEQFEFAFSMYVYASI